MPLNGDILRQDVQIVELGEEHVNDAAALLARAFQNDPILVHASPDVDLRARILPWLFRWSTWKGLRSGVLLGTARCLDGVAALIGPEDGEFTAQDIERIDHERAREAIGPAVWDEVLAAISVDATPAEADLHAAIRGPYWYLDELAVEPHRQGQGIGSALLREVAARADANGLPIVLMTCQPANVPLYLRHGYVEVSRSQSPGSPVQWWGMMREPVR